jgi:hypothetical protein
VDYFKPSLDYISSGDGQTQTVIFAENVQGQNWHLANLANIGAGGTSVADLAFGVPVDLLTDVDPRPGRFGLTDSTLVTMDSLDASPGSNILALSGTLPRPSSYHLGTSIYGFADGGTRQIADNIDFRVYAKLLTPNGQRYGQSVLGTEGY